MASQKDAQMKHRMSIQSQTRISQQKKAFLGWINAYLQQRLMRINTLEDISQVSPLIHLLEILEKKPLNKITKNHKKARNKFDKMEGMTICLSYIQSREGDNVNPMDAEKLVSSTEIKDYLALAWRIIVTYGIQRLINENENDNENDNEDDNENEKENENDNENENDIINDSKSDIENENKPNENIQKQEPKKQKKKTVKSPEQCLIQWVNTKLSEQLHISNFTTEWSDGKVLIYLMNQVLVKHNQVKPTSIQNMNNKQLLHNILEINDKHLHIPQLLDPNDLITAPNKEAVMTYVLLLKAAIENKDALISAQQKEINIAPDAFDQIEHLDEIKSEILSEKIKVSNNGENENENENENKNDCDLMIPGATTDGMNSEEEISDEDTSENNVDLCVLCDVTDSMKPWIDQIKTGIRGIINNLKDTFGIGTLRLSFIGYRDWDDDNNNKAQKRIEKLKFKRDIVYFESFVENVKPVGGGDAAEDVLGGIQEALNLKWKAPIRVIYHICDAPAHGTMYHDYFEKFCRPEENIKDDMSFLDGISGDESDSDDEKKDDDDELLMMEGNDDDICSPLDKERELKLLRDEYDKWPDKYPQDPKHQDLFSQLKQKRIHYFLGTQTTFTDKMVNVFREYCDSIDYALTTVDLYNVSQLLPTLIAAVKNAVRVVIPPKDEDIPDINLQELQRKKVNFRVHCGIDFGTAGSGFAYSLPGKDEVYTDQNWNNSGKHVDVKTKTNILLDTKGNCIAFGDDATDKYTHTDTNDLFFERFKMALYEQQINDQDEKKSEMVSQSQKEQKENSSFEYKYDEKKSEPNNYSKIDIKQYLTAANGKQLPSRKVLEEALRFMKDHAMNNLRAKVNKNLKIQEVQFIVTVPAIWSDKAKYVMQTAAINAGMIDPSVEGQLIIAYEPDCAGLSILHEINEKARAIAKQQRLMDKHKENKNDNEQVQNDEDTDQEIEYESYFHRGDKILLCDLGGGTADIACHQIDEKERIRQIVAPSGGAWGSTYVDENFLDLLNEIFGQKRMSEFKREEPCKYIEFLQNFRDSKKTYKMNDKKVKKQLYDTTFHNIKVPFTFLDFMGEQAEEMDDVQEIENEEDDMDDLEKIVLNFSKFNRSGLVRLNEEYLEVSYTIWNYLFNKVVDCIVNHCQKLLDLPEMNGCKFLCLVGGFSESKHLQNVMFKNFGKNSKYDILIFTPKRPILSVVDGAARMGLRPDFISARTIAKTYGIAIQKDLEEFKRIYPHSMHEKLIPKAKVSKRLIYSKKNENIMISTEVVNDVFLPFVRKNQLIKNNDKPIIYWVEPADIKANKISIRLYDSDNVDPIFVDDKRQANKIDITLTDKYKSTNKKPIPIIFVFNDTTIRVFVTMINNSGEKEIQEISVNFDVVR